MKQWIMYIRKNTILLPSVGQKWLVNWKCNNLEIKIFDLMYENVKVNHITL